MKFKTILLLTLFLGLVFVLSFYDLFYILKEARSGELGKEPTLLIFLGVNFLPKVIYYLLKFFTLTGIIYGSMLMFKLGNFSKNKSWVRIFRLLVVAEFILLFVVLYKVIYFGFINVEYSIGDHQNFYPFTLYNPEESGFLNRLAMHLSPFDALYILFLIVRLSDIFDIEVGKTAGLVAFSYLLPLIFWTFFLQFIGF